MLSVSVMEFMDEANFAWLVSVNDEGNDTRAAEMNVVETMHLALHAYYLPWQISPSTPADNISFFLTTTVTLHFCQLNWFAGIRPRAEEFVYQVQGARCQD